MTFHIASQVTWVPIEGLSGENLKSRLEKDKCDWYDGPSLLGALDNIEIPKRDKEGPLRMTVADKYRESDIYVMGKIFRGKVAKGQTVMCMPAGATSPVISIQGRPGQGLSAALDPSVWSNI